MKWPFTKRNRPVKSPMNSETDYNRCVRLWVWALREDDCCEGVAFIVIVELLASEVTDECKRLPVEEQPLFMMTYASYLSWLTMQGIEKYLSPGLMAFDRSST